MKIKLPCKLCEVSVEHSKLGVSNCTHSTFPFSTHIPMFFPPAFNLNGLPIQNPTLLRDMMLAAYLFRGEFNVYSSFSTMNVPILGNC